MPPRLDFDLHTGASDEPVTAYRRSWSNTLRGDTPDLLWNPSDGRYLGQRDHEHDSHRSTESTDTGTTVDAYHALFRPRRRLRNEVGAERTGDEGLFANEIHRSPQEQQQAVNVRRVQQWFEGLPDGHAGGVAWRPSSLIYLNPFFLCSWRSHRERKQEHRDIDGGERELTRLDSTRRKLECY